MIANRLVQLVFLIILIFAICNCRNRKEPTGSMFFNLKDTVLNFNVNVFAESKFEQNHYDLIFYNYSSSTVREIISIETIEDKKVRSNLRSEEGKHFKTKWFNMYADGDVLGGVLEVDTLYKDTNWIEITEMDKKFKKIKGKFQAMMVVKSGNRWGDSGTHIFIHGEFNARRYNRD